MLTEVLSVSSGRRGSWRQGRMSLQLCRHARRPQLLFEFPTNAGSSCLSGGTRKSVGVDPKNRVGHSVTAKSRRFLDSRFNKEVKGFIGPFASGIHIGNSQHLILELRDRREDRSLKLP